MNSNELPTKPGVYWCTTYTARKALEVYYNGIELVANTRCGGQSTPIRLMTDAQWLRIPGPDKLMEMQRKADQWDALGRNAEQPAADLAGYPVDVVGRVAIELDAQAQETAKKLSGKAIAERLNGNPDPGFAGGIIKPLSHDWKCPNGCTRGNSVLIVGGVTYAKCYACGETNETVDPWIALYREHIKREDVPKWAKWVCAWERGGGVSWASSDPDEYGMCTAGRMTTRGGLDAMPPGGLDSLRRVADVWSEGGE